MFVWLFVLCIVQKVEKRPCHLVKEFLRLRSFNALISFPACELRGDVELF